MFNPITLKYLLQNAWGLFDSYLFELEKKMKNILSSLIQILVIQKMIILCYVLCQVWINIQLDIILFLSWRLIDTRRLKKYSANYLYAVNMCRKKSRDSFISIDVPMYQKRFNNSYKQFFILKSDEKSWWEHIHLNRQPYTKEEIINTRSKNPQSSWRDLEKKIGFWCWETMIRRWVTLQKGYKIYSKRIIPLLSMSQRRKHLDFSKHYVKNWGIGLGK